MSHWTAFIGSFIASHVLVDDVRIPHTHYEALKPTIKEVESWSGMFSDLEIDKPQTWVKTGKKVLEKISHIQDPYRTIATDLITEVMKRIDYEHTEFPGMENIIDIAAQKADVRLVHEELPDRLYQIYLPNGTSFFMKTNKYMDLEKPGLRSKGGDKKMYFPSSKYPKKYRRKVLKGIGDLFWEEKEHLILDLQPYKSITYKPVDLPDRSYEGGALSYIEEWKTFMDHDVRRCILLQGEPGTGKSTLARHASNLISKRTLHLTQAFVINIDRNQWGTLSNILRPDIIVVDDIDRIDHGYLQNRLYLFEDTYHDVPLTIMTSNHYSNLPDAFLRPGRIDQIIELNDPDDSLKESVLRSLAKREGLEVPKEKMKFLLEIYKNYSGAYVVEYLRRVKVLGWDYKIPQMDKTYEKIVGFEDRMESQDEDSDTSKNPKILSFRVLSEENEDNGKKSLCINPVTSDQ